MIAILASKFSKIVYVSESSQPSVFPFVALDFPDCSFKNLKTKTIVIAGVSAIDKLPKGLRYHVTNRHYSRCLVGRSKMHGINRKFAGTDCSISLLADCRIRRILLYSINKKGWFLPN